MEDMTLPGPDRALAEPNEEVLGFRTRCHALPAVLAGTHSPSWTPPSCPTSQAHPKKGPPSASQGSAVPPARSPAAAGPEGSSSAALGSGLEPVQAPEESEP